MHCCFFFFFQEPILKIWLQIVVKAGAINFDALHQLLYLFICFASIIKAKEAFFNKTDEIISYNMYTVAMDTTTKPF